MPPLLAGAASKLLVQQPTVSSKYCPRCSTEKPADDFHRRTTAPDGLQLYCKPCTLTAIAASRQRRLAGNPDARRKPPPLPQGLSAAASGSGRGAAKAGTGGAVGALKKQARDLKRQGGGAVRKRCGGRPKAAAGKLQAAAASLADPAAPEPRRKKPRLTNAPAAADAGGAVQGLEKAQAGKRPSAHAPRAAAEAGEERRRQTEAAAAAAAAQMGGRLGTDSVAAGTVGSTRKSKPCRVCSQVLPLSSFGPNSSTRDGLTNTCRACRRATRTKLHVPEPTVSHKTCARCGVRKPAAAFNRLTCAASGLRSRCRMCDVKPGLKLGDAKGGPPRKECASCGRQLPVTVFEASGSHRHPSCRTCMLEARALGPAADFAALAASSKSKGQASKAAPAAAAPVSRPWMVYQPPPSALGEEEPLQVNAPANGKSVRKRLRAAGVDQTIARPAAKRRRQLGVTVHGFNIPATHSPKGLARKPWRMTTAEAAATVASAAAARKLAGPSATARKPAGASAAARPTVIGGGGAKEAAEELGSVGASSGGSGRGAWAALKSGVAAVAASVLGRKGPDVRLPATMKLPKWSAGRGAADAPHVRGRNNGLYPEPTVSAKSCGTCHMHKPAAAFSRCTSHPSGLQAQCKACNSAYNRTIRGRTPAKSGRKPMQQSKLGRRKTAERSDKFTRAARPSQLLQKALQRQQRRQGTAASVGAGKPPAKGKIAKSLKTASRPLPRAAAPVKSRLEAAAVIPVSSSQGSGSTTLPSATHASLAQQHVTSAAGRNVGNPVATEHAGPGDWVYLR